MDFVRERIVTDPSIANGQPCLRMYRPSLDDPAVYLPLTELFTEADSFEPPPGLTDKEINLCLAFAATHMPGTEEFRRNNRYRNVRILLDENLPYGLITPLSVQLSNLSHVYLEGLGGYTDQFIYNRPWYFLKEGAAHERRRNASKKHIIISRDSDLTDLAREQWMARIRVSAAPEEMDFSDINVIFRVLDDDLTSAGNAFYYQDQARDIMRAAFSGVAASYLITKTGVYPEPGSRKEDLIRAVEKEEKLKQMKAGEMGPEEMRIREFRAENRPQPVMSLFQQRLQMLREQAAIRVPAVA